MYRRVRADHSALPAEHALSLAVSAVNNTAGPAGILPTLLVFGIVPRSPICPGDLPAQKARLEEIRTAPEVTRRTVARARVREARRMRVLRATDADVATGMAVLVLREKPVIVGNRNHMQINVYTLHGVLQLFTATDCNITQRNSTPKKSSPLQKMSRPV